MDNTVEETSPVRRSLTRLTPPFWVYVTGEKNLYPVPHRYHPQGIAVKVTEMKLEDPHTLSGMTEDGESVNFGGPNARHWVIADPEAIPAEAPEVAEVKERIGSKGESHYLSRMDANLRRWTIEKGKVSRALRVSEERIARYREGIVAERKRREVLLKEKRQVVKNLNDAKKQDRKRKAKEKKP